MLYQLSYEASLEAGQVRRTTCAKDHRLFYLNYPQIKEVGKSDHVDASSVKLYSGQTNLLSSAVSPQFLNTDNMGLQIPLPGMPQHV